MDEDRLPLSGIRVLEVGNFFAGPFAALQLADLGADVVKVENPHTGGDEVRRAGPFVDGESSAFVRVNRNKRSLVLDLKDPAGADSFRRLAVRADVIVENLRPGVMRSLGLAYEDLVAANPGLIYLAASGFGQSGPYATHAGLDVIAQGMSGLMSITGEPDGPPTKVGVPVVDLTCALYGTVAVLAALRRRDRTGVGDLIDVSLLESGVALQVWEAGIYFGSGEVPGRHGSAHQSLAPYQPIRAEDGEFIVGAATQRTWLALCDVLGRDDLAADPRFADNTGRLAQRAELVAEIERTTRTRPLEHWVESLRAVGVPSGPINSYDRVSMDPQLAERGFFWDAPHATLGPVRQVGSPMRFRNAAVRRGAAGPTFGQHTAEVLDELAGEEETTRT